MIKRITQRLPVSPHVTTYTVFVSTPETIIDKYEQEYEPPDGYSSRVLTPDDFSRLDAARSGYASVAEKRIDDGHTGIVAVNDGNIASVAWLYRNLKDETTNVMYYDLGPKNAWFHSAWTHQNYRGNGLHTWLIYERAQYLLDVGSVGTIESNIGVNNKISTHNYAKLGFENDRQFTMFYVHDLLNVKW